MKLQNFKLLARYARDAAIWRLDNARLIRDQLTYPKKNLDSGFSDHDHLLAAAHWLERAQDTTGDGGVSGRYELKSGWNPSYPETTGYIIPTFLALASELGDNRFKDRAERCVNFLLRIQLENGSFPGGEIHVKNTQPSVFNTAQIINGLMSWNIATGDGQALRAARRAADWLLSVQDSDGAWRRYIFNGVVTAYSAHASCWLAELGRQIGDKRYLDAASRHLDWVLSHQKSETGWFHFCGFYESDHESGIAVTHTIAYTIWGILVTSEILKRSDGVNAAYRAGEAIARRLELSGFLPGILDFRWRKRAEYSCLTGNAQMALIWFRLYSATGEIRLLNAALKAIDLVKAAQPMFNLNSGILGGIAGSDPIWGDYIYMAFPNWPVKFFIDALLAKKTVLSTISERPLGDWQTPGDLPQALPAINVKLPKKPLKVIMYSSPSSWQVAQMVSAWSSWNFKPSMVVIERSPKRPIRKRLKKKMKEGGFQALFSSVLKKISVRRCIAGTTSKKPVYPDAITFCRRENIPILEVENFESPEGVKSITNIQPDLAIHAGAGILRAPLLSIPRFGTLNAHMGILPYYKGMNVTEWAAFQGDPVGCTVHLIDPGIDTGDILCVRFVDSSSALSIPQLRRIVDRAQIELLGDVVRYILTTGELPPRRKQHIDAGKQFFRMHSELAAILEAELKRQSNMNA